MIITFLACNSKIKVDEEYIVLYMALVEFILETIGFVMFIGQVTQ